MKLFHLHLSFQRSPVFRLFPYLVSLLAQTFLREFASETGKEVKGFTPEVIDLLLRYEWPGNVRELRTAIEHAVVMCRGDKLTTRDLRLFAQRAMDRFRFL